jgi:hypothetical protein
MTDATGRHPAFPRVSAAASVGEAEVKSQQAHNITTMDGAPL